MWHFARGSALLSPESAQRAQARPPPPSGSSVGLSRRCCLCLSTCGPAASRGALVSQPLVRAQPRQARAAPPGRRRDSKSAPDSSDGGVQRTPGGHRDVAHHQRRLRLREHQGSSRRGVGPGLAGEADGAENLITQGGGGERREAVVRPVHARPTQRRAARYARSPRSGTPLPARPPDGDRRGPSPRGGALPGSDSVCL